MEVQVFMLFQIVHSAGSAIYFVFFVLLLLASRVPRTNPGCGWWAAAIFVAFIARLTFLHVQADDAALAKLLYALLSITEKLLLLIGAARFFGVVLSRRTLLFVVLLMQLWLLNAHLYQFSTAVYSFGLALFNAVCLLIFIITVWYGSVALQRGIKLTIILTCALLMLHWLLFVPISRMLYQDWRTMAFIIGTALVVMQYTALIAAVLSLFQQRLLESESKALELAYKDPLTGLSNKRYVDTLFGKALQLATRPHQFLALYYIDLDKFKPVNDQAGHKVGDLVLKEVAQRMQTCLRSTDICARIGGDEFVVIATQLEQQSQAAGIAEKILQSLQQPYVVEGKTYQLGASIGISLYPEHGAAFSDLLEKADTAMYQMKNAGRGGYRIFHSEIA
ncbi:GGDEF domain-containing protein [Rheinheimera oceanensis]|uniref:GGDEF domain-containing protein n=1 Tax=Rheinheimera oceanensis TaxID=2817449 RepID=UPI001BFE55C7|nr:GGDEF domain-containing protein [Rheinheimera oceanensis]